MTGGSENGTRSEAADLAERVAGFRAAWQADGTADLEAFLPAPPAAHRPLVLVELVKADMELRAKARLPVRVEPYLGRFRHDLPPTAIVSLIAHEYRLRHRLDDKPTLAEFQSRFPEQFERFDTLSAELRRDLIESLSFGPADTDTPPPAAPTGPHQTLRAGPLASDTLPADLNYRLIRPIGTGAYGYVYEAEAPGGFRVAVKWIIRHVDDPASRGEIEALETIKAISHPFLLQTQAYWVFQDHIVIVMELADGSLTERIEHHKSQGLPGVPPGELIPLFEQAAEALDYLHSQSITHRDVKPANLLLLKGYAKVADFGLARGHEQTLMDVGAAVGTPLYMAPEAWQQKVSLHSDQYSLAASYVQARLGRPLFTTRALHELSAAHADETPDLDPLPGDEQRVLLRALAKKPDRRYPSCLEFARALRAAVLVSERPAPPPSRWLSAARLVAAALVCGLTLGTIALVGRPPSGTGTVVTPPKDDVVQPPDGWAAVAEEGTEPIGGRTYHKRLTRDVDGERLVAILVPKAGPNDPPTFYMLENKVTNKVFRAVWAQTGRPFPPLKGETDPLMPGKWQHGVKLDDGGHLGIDGKHADLPVVGVTVLEAMLVAEQLGGLLPTYKQWLRAVGALEEGEPRGRNLAVDVTVPWPVTRPTDDVRNGIHQLTSNGVEWTRELSRDDGEPSPGGQLLTPTDRPRTEFWVRIVGWDWSQKTPLTLWNVQNQRLEGRWDKTEEQAGFRIVLEPQ